VPGVDALIVVDDRDKTTVPAVDVDTVPVPVVPPVVSPEVEPLPYEVPLPPPHEEINPNATTTAKDQQARVAERCRLIDIDSGIV
jgi:hypothetical protein